MYTDRRNRASGLPDARYMYTGVDALLHEIPPRFTVTNVHQAAVSIAEFVMGGVLGFTTRLIAANTDMRRCAWDLSSDSRGEEQDNAGTAVTDELHHHPHLGHPHAVKHHHRQTSRARCAVFPEHPTVSGTTIGILGYGHIGAVGDITVTFPFEPLCVSHCPSSLLGLVHGVRVGAQQMRGWAR
jgi:phosphoglycerate dehydrogenase-like enzyme